MAVLYGAAWDEPGTARRVVHALAHLQMLLGNLDLPGGGVNPLRAQNNLQGACDMGCRPGCLPGYQSPTDPTIGARFEAGWGAALPPSPGLSAPEMLAAARHGLLHALYVAGEEILNTSSEAANMRQALQTLDFVVLQESLPSEADRYADVLLPGVSFAEKTGTFTSAERRIQMVQQAIQPLGGARPDWQIIAGLAQRILAQRSLAPDGRPPEPCQFAGWAYDDIAQVMQEIAALTPIYAGITHERLAQGSLQWPVESLEHPGTLRLHSGYFSGGELRWAGEEQETALETR
jgi:predicted molibdopterin-dependent oxidoreductase YjgC